VITNLDYQVFDKNGTSLLGPIANNALWAGFGGGCQTHNDGDPVVLYDQLADRWLLMQFTASSPYYNCVALSTTNDPTGTFYRWAFPVGGGSNFGDYPKMGVWPDAYHISTREFAGGSTFVGLGAYAIDRPQMLAGNPNPTVISFLVPPSPAYLVGDGFLPADLDGGTVPPAGSDEYYMGSQDNTGGYGAPTDALNLFKFHVDFSVPANSSFTLANTLLTAPFQSRLALCGSGRSCIPQPGTSNRVDHQGYRQRPIFRLAYRNMGSYETLVTNQSVSAGTGPDGEVSGIQWWEVRSPASSPSIYQQGLYAPGLTDGIHRWMGSIAMDGQGNMGMGYSASSATVFPGVYYTGRLASDPLGTMPQGEGAIVVGTGSQTSSQRWGDYSDITVDPSDDCTFWYVNEYVPTTSGAGWRARIGAFKFPGCGAATATPTATPTNTPTDTSTSTPTNTRTNTATDTPVGSTSTSTPVPPTATNTPGGPTETPVPVCTISFEDVPVGSTFYPFIQCLACQGIINGYPCGGPGEPCNPANDPYFRPGNNVTRGQFAKIASNSAGFNEPPGAQQYADVAVGSTFFDFIWRLSDRGYINGYPCGGPGEPCGSDNLPYFRPNANVTRGQLSKIDANAAGFDETPGAQQYEDVVPGSTFYDFIWRLSDRGIINGYPCGGNGEPCGPNNLPYFRPGANATRGQASKIVSNTFFPTCNP
jgi:hypothetical protein